MTDQNLEVKSDPESSGDKVELISTLYDNFYYYLDYGYECVKLEIDLLLNHQVAFKESNELNNLINEFNSKHASKISYDRLISFQTYDEILMYAPAHYYLKLNFPISQDSESLINSIMTFYSDFHSLCSDNPFGRFEPQLLVDDCPVPSGFLSYLQKEISQLKALQIDPELIKW